MPAQPAPSELDHDGTDATVACFADALFALACAAVVRRTRKPREGADLPAVVELAPAEEFRAQDRSTCQSDTAKALEPCDLLVDLCARFVYTASLLCVDLRYLRLDEL